MIIMGVNNSASFLPKRNKNAYCIEVVDLQKMYLFCLSPPCHMQSYFKECLLLHEKWLRRKNIHSMVIMKQINAYVHYAVIFLAAVVAKTYSHKLQISLAIFLVNYFQGKIISYTIVVYI
jgi:hypothetical protein